MAFQDSWTELCLVEVAKFGFVASQSKLQFAALTETVDISQGDKPVTFVANIKGGRIPKYDPEEPTEITLEMYPVGISNENGLKHWFLGDTDANTVPVLSSTATHTRHKFRVTILWTTLSTVTEAGGAVSGADESALRGIYRGAYLTSYKDDFTEPILKCTATFMCPPFDKDGSGLIEWQETNDADPLGTDELSALAEVGYDS